MLLFQEVNRKGPKERMSILRHLEETDFQPIIRIVDDWWGGRPVAVLLQRLFFVHFRPTSFAVEENGTIRIFWLVSVLRRRQLRRIFILWEPTLNIVAKVLAVVYTSTSMK